MSDSVPDVRQGDLDDRIEDVCAVLDAVGVDRVSVIAEADGALTAIKFAVEHPERVDKLVLLNGYAAGVAAAPSLGAALHTSPEHLDELADSVRVCVGQRRAGRQGRCRTLVMISTSAPGLSAWVPGRAQPRR